MEQRYTHINSVRSAGKTQWLVHRYALRELCAFNGMWWCISRGTAFAITSGTIERDRLADSSMGACKSKRAMSVVKERRQQSRTLLNAPMIGQGNGGATRALVVGAYRTSGLRDWKK